MKLSLEYLCERHDYWKNEIGRAEIWDADLFLPVTIKIRPKSKCYNGLFSRRWSKKRGKSVMVDKISIYKNSEDFDPIFLDSLLVHEMIHQYISQAKIKDSSTHGKIFKTFMRRINQEFAGKLSINISDRNPSAPLSGPGKTIHKIILSWTDQDCYCCVINPSKILEFDKMLKKFKKKGIVKDYLWAVSNDVLFDRYSRCTKTLHGIKKPMTEMIQFCREHNVMKSPI